MSACTFFQAGQSLGTPVSGTSQSGPGITNSFGSGFGTSLSELGGSRQSSGHRHSLTNSTGEAQPGSGASDPPSFNFKCGVRILPFGTMMGAIPVLDRLPSESPGAPVGMYYPVLGRYPNASSGNLSSRTRNHVSSESHPQIQSDANGNPGSTVYQQKIEDPAGNGMKRGILMQEHMFHLASMLEKASVKDCAIQCVEGDSYWIFCCREESFHWNVIFF